jgi:hypothetical protein
MLSGKRARKVSFIVGIFLSNFVLVGMSQASSDVQLWKEQTVYVPVYSQFYWGDRQHPVNLSANLSVRNTEPENSITVYSVDYYDSEGTLVKKYLQKPRKMNPMSSVYFYVKTSDTTGGWGANFIVQWKAEEGVAEPVIEALMTGGIGTHAFSFISRGKAVRGVSE